MPLVSVIMPAYNHERFVAEAVHSVWTQTYPDVELIVLDDGSRDRTVEILRDLEASSPIPMRVVSKANEGLTRTLNLGLSLARGTFIGLHSGDDRYLPHHIATLVAASRRAPPGTVVYGDAYVIDGEGRRTGARLSDGRPLRSGAAFEALLRFEFVLPGLAALIPAAHFAEAGGYNEASALDDWEMFLHITRRHPVQFVEDTLAEYRAHGDGQLTRDVGRLVPDMIRVFEENAQLSPHASNGTWLRRSRSILYARIGYSYYIIRDFPAARHWFVRSLGQWPLQPTAHKFYLRSLLGARIVRGLSHVRRLVRSPAS